MQQQMEANREKLATTITETENFLANEIKTARAHVQDELRQRGESLKGEILSGFLPQLKDHTQQLAAHLQESAQKLGEHFHHSGNQTQQKVTTFVQAFHQLHIEQITTLTQRVQRL